VNTQKLPSFWSFLWISLVLCVIGWGGLILLVFLTLPNLGPRWMFFFLFTLAMSGTALPVVYFFNRRFPSNPPVDGNIVLREAMWCGIYFSLLAWLQMGRVLNSGLAFALAVGLILVEFLLRLGDRSQWSPARATAAMEASGQGASSADIEDEDEANDEEEDE
jgi:hypothetical protein